MLQRFYLSDIEDFQVAYDLPFQEIDAFELKSPKIISMQSFLSQLP